MVRGLVAGILIWLLARIVLRFTGQWFLDDEPFTLLFGFTVMTLGAVACVWFAVRWFCPAREQLWPFGIGLVAPGLLGDAVITMFFGLIYPNIGADLAAGYGSWVLWGHGMTLASLIVFGPRAVAVRDHAI